MVGGPPVQMAVWMKLVGQMVLAVLRAEQMEVAVAAMEAVQRAAYSCSSQYIHFGHCQTADSQA